MENSLNTVLFLFHCRHASVCLSQGAMPEMEKESIIDSENGPQSPTVAHQTTDIIGQKQVGSSLPEMNHTEDSDSQKNLSVEGNNQKIERFLSPSPVSRSYEGQATESDDEEEERSRSTEDSQTVEEWNRESSVRPQTAPLMDIIGSGRQTKRDSIEMRTKSVPLSITEPELITTDQTRAENDPQSDKAIAWHPHVYAKPPKQPTPHSISDILGLSRTRLDSGSNGELYKEDIIRHSFHRMGSSMSMSESSDSEEQFRGGEQPLNLCVSKARSPVGKERPSKGKGE